MGYIDRALESVAIQTDRTFKCLLATGARQTGKTTLIKRLFPDKRYVPIDDPFIEEQAADNPNMFIMLNPPPAIFDEVQRVPELFRYIKAVCDGRDECGLFCLSGSQPLELMERASESLSGRVGIVELGGLSLREIAGDPFERAFVPSEDYALERAATAQAPADVWSIIHRGGYPALQDAGVDWQMFFSSYVKTYLERDVRALSAVHDLNDFRRFMVAAAARTGQMLNYANIASDIGMDQATAKSWMSILEATGIVYLLEPYTPNVLKKAVKTPKLYFRDTGLAAYLTRWLTPETLANGAMSGAFFETFAVGEILKSYSNRGMDYRYCVSYYRGRDKKKLRRNGEEVRVDAEIDLIIEKDGVLHPVEIKKASRATADDALAFDVLDKVPDKRRGEGCVLCLCPSPGLLRDGIWQLPIWFV